MYIYELKQEQFLRISQDEAWYFFSNPANLNRITPENLGFKIISKPVENMYDGQIIKYSIKLLPGISTSWVSEIKSVVPGESFIDEQRFGPYKFWHHRHTFRQTEEGIIMTDKVHYGLPFGIIGRIVHRLYIRKRLMGIFSYRYNWLDSYFNKKSGL